MYRTKKQIAMSLEREALKNDYERACIEHGPKSEYARELRAQLEGRK